MALAMMKTVLNDYMLLILPFAGAHYEQNRKAIEEMR
jgi:hypothetical protein